MNLADAIRQAAYGGTFDPETPEYVPPQPEAHEEPATPVKASKPSGKSQSAPSGKSSEEPHAMPSNAMVRMELFLSPEQLSALFKAVVNTQHSVMTLREAASYLRINPATLEQMAQHGDVAAFVVNGRWRFPKPGLDEWVTLNTFRKEDADAA